MKRRPPPWWLLGVYGLLAAGVFFARPQALIADDSYFYLVVARNLALSGEHTFSGIVPTNGFHPLWAYLLTAYSWALAQLDPRLLSQPASLAPLALSVLAVGSLFYWRIAERLDVNPLLVTLVPLGYVTAFGVLGSEGHLLYAMLGLLLFTLLGDPPSATHPVWVGMAAAGVLLTRLDMIFVVAPLYLWYLATQHDLRPVLLAGLVTSLPVMVYLWGNLTFFGGLTPVSGWLKSTFPQPGFSGLIRNGLASGISGYSLIAGVGPLTLSLIATALLRPSRRPTSILLPLVAGCLLHMLYITLFTVGATTWVWYYVLPVVTAAIALALMMRRFTPHLEPTLTGAAAAIFTGLLLLNLTQGLEPKAQTLLNTLETQAISDATILVSDYPGIVAYTTSNKVIAADMLTGSRPLVTAMLASPNALDTLFNAAEQAGHPIDYVIWTGNSTLSASPDRTRVIYYHPGPPPDPIGQRDLGPPAYDGAGLIIWQVER